jgi:hypothetical protein
MMFIGALALVTTVTVLNADTTTSENPELPSFETWIKSAQPANPSWKHEDLWAHWLSEYGMKGAPNEAPKPNTLKIALAAGLKLVAALVLFVAAHFLRGWINRRAESAGRLPPLPKPLSL